MQYMCCCLKVQELRVYKNYDTQSQEKMLHVSFKYALVVDYVLQRCFKKSKVYKVR